MARTTHKSFFTKVDKHQVRPTMLKAQKQVEAARSNFFYLDFKGSSEVTPEMKVAIRDACEKLLAATSAVQQAITLDVTQKRAKGEAL